MTNETMPESANIGQSMRSALLRAACQCTLAAWDSPFQAGTRVCTIWLEFSSPDRGRTALCCLGAERGSFVSAPSEARDLSVLKMKICAFEARDRGGRLRAASDEERKL